MSTLGTILKDNWEWRHKISRLALFELVKKSRGAVLSWAWFFIKPLMYVLCFWFALEIGLRATGSSFGADAPPYILWLYAGLVPWFFEQDMIGTGCDVLRRYPYLVNKIKFPISCISTIYVLASLIVHLMLLVVLFALYFACGQGLDVYLLQVPIALVLMFVFWTAFSVGVSQLSALSKDVANLMHAISTPVFWLSGVIFNIKSVPVPWIQSIMNYNPVTFFTVVYRDAFYEKVWFWEDPSMCVGFAIVLVVTIVFAVWVYGKFNEEVADVL